MNHTFTEWVNPDRLRINPDGTLALNGGGDVTSYLAAWAKHIKVTEPVPVTLMTRGHAEVVNFPWGA
jgi:hypothetical protein